MELVRWTTVFLDFLEEDFEAGVDFWSGLFHATRSEPRGDLGEFGTFLPADGDAYAKFQRVGTGGGLHLDLHVDDVDAAVGGAVEVGASVVASRDGYAVLRSSGGLVFCFVTHPARTRPTPYPGVPDQVCLDVPPDLFDAEVAFWTALLGWDSHPGSHPAMHVLERPDGQALRILLQRLDEGEPPVRAHLDLAAGDQVQALAAEHRTQGATQVRDGAWVTLRDPVGREYCLTPRSPATGRLA
ncbi:MAG: VOC family protein [Nocardioidaceae bacterium]